MTQSKHKVVPYRELVNSHVVGGFWLDGRWVPTFCRRDFITAVAEMKLLVRYSLPVNVASLQGSEHTNADVASCGVVVANNVCSGVAPVLGAMHEGGAK